MNYENALINVALRSRKMTRIVWNTGEVKRYIFLSVGLTAQSYSGSGVKQVEETLLAWDKEENDQVYRVYTPTQEDREATDWYELDRRD